MTAEATRKLPADDQSARPLLGKVVDQRYRVLAHIGSGGMADVYEVEHVALGRRLAMKVLRQTRAASPQLARRFTREARAASRLHSEHVVSIHDYGVLAEGLPYFVMELLRGQNLRSLLVCEHRLPVPRAVNIGIDVCLGLHAAHAAGLVHRDLKPENLWLARGDDGREKAVLLDFGVARFEGAHSTSDGALVGTARYMSPEQIGSERAPGPASDLFSLALVLYECVTGVSPFRADSLERTLFRILNDKQEPARSLVEEVPHELSDVLDRALAKEPEHRFKDALELAASLRPFAGVTRPLPSIDLAHGQALSNETLAEDPVVDAAFYGAAPGSARPSESSRGAVALGFAAGLLLGGTGLWALRSAAPPSAPGAAATSSAPPALLPSSIAPPLPAVAEPASAPSTTRDAPPPDLSGRSPPVTRSKARAGAAAPPAAPASARPEPPKPTFDGRNPYLQ